MIFLNDFSEFPQLYPGVFWGLEKRQQMCKSSEVQLFPHLEFLTLLSGIIFI